MIKTKAQSTLLSFPVACSLSDTNLSCRASVSLGNIPSANIERWESTDGTKVSIQPPLSSTQCSV